MRNALDFALFVDHGVHRRHLAIDFSTELGLSKVQAARQFPDTQDIKSMGDQFILDRGRVGQGRETHGRPEVGKKPKMFAERKQRASFGLLLRRKMLPLRSPDRSKKNRISRLTRGQCTRR